MITMMRMNTISNLFMAFWPLTVKSLIGPIIAKKKRHEAFKEKLKDEEIYISSLSRIARFLSALDN